MTVPTHLAELAEWGEPVVVSVPLARRFRGVEHREALLLRGPRGWSEWSPFLEYDSIEAGRWLAAAVSAGWEDPSVGSTVGDVSAVTTIGVNATVPAVAADDVAAVLKRFGTVRTAKVKVAEPGQSLRDDLDRVAAVRDALGPNGRIRVDANGAWSVAEALSALKELHHWGLEYAEQPCASVEELALLRRELDGAVPIAADESIRKSTDPRRVADEGAADLMIVKVQPLGGARRALAIVDACGLPAVVSSALETSVGLASGITLAAALDIRSRAAGSAPHDHGLGTAALLAGDVVDPALRPVDGRLPVGAVTPSPELCERWAASADVAARWRARLADCWPHARAVLGSP